MNLDLTGIRHFRFDLLCDISCEKNHLVFRDFLRLYHDADLAAGLNGIRACNAREAARNLFQLFQTLDIVFNVFTAGTRTGGGNRISRLNQAGNHGMRLNIVVVSFHCVDDVFVFFIFAKNINTDGDVRTFHFMVDALADIMQETRTLCCVDIDAEF